MQETRGNAIEDCNRRKKMKSLTFSEGCNILEENTDAQRKSGSILYTVI